MSIINVNKDSYETITIVTTPSRKFSSGSSGITGSVKVFPRLSESEKESTEYRRAFDDASDKPDALNDSNFTIEYDKTVREAGQARKSTDNADIGTLIENYFDLVEKTPVRPNQTLEISRIVPTPKLTKNTLTKSVIKNTLFNFYKGRYSSLDWAYKNYHSLNFFTSGPSGASTNKSFCVPTGSFLFYPSVPDTTLAKPGHSSGSYSLSGAFSFDFHINPRYKTDDIDDSSFKAGTIFHLSSSYALSLVTGTLKDINGYPQGFRLQLQLSHSADFAPSKATQGPYPRDLVFLSDDNSLTWNKWHHVVVRWGTNLVNGGTGSFVVDGTNRGFFVIPSGTIAPKTYDAPRHEPDVLCIGNFYEGVNTGSGGQVYFFSQDNAARDGVLPLTSQTSAGPDKYAFRHPLKAEVHDLVIRRYYMSDSDISYAQTKGMPPESLTKENIAFYLPPFFVEDTPIRRNVGSGGGILQTPFFEIDGTTDDPFNVAMAFGVNGHYINLENFTKDFATNRFPRLMMLSASVVDYTTEAKEANDFIYEDRKAVKRNLTILPCDDGLFRQNYGVLSRERLKNKYLDFLGHYDPTLVSLDNLVTTGSLTGKITSEDQDDNSTYEDYRQELIGPTPENPGYQPGSAMNTYISYVNSTIGSLTDDYNFDRGVQRGAPLTIYQRLKDPSSNQITIFNISNLFYGYKINPGTFVLSDTSLTGSNGKVSMTLRDDGHGGLYRDDSDTETDRTNTVGNIFYDEGLVVIKNPHLYFFGKDNFSVEFQGVKNIYTTKYEILAPSGLLNSSSNVTYLSSSSALKASNNPKDNDTFVYISGMYFHDENMNVVAKAKLAQPIIKREQDKILFKVSLDW
jgi:hypothetical protein